METPFKKSIDDLSEFVREGIRFTMIGKNQDTGLYLAKGTFPGEGGETWEVVKPKKYINPDGNVVMIYPSTNDWGVNAWSFGSGQWAEYVWKYGYESFCRMRDEWRKRKIEERKNIQNKLYIYDKI